jgi:hypothetical protein
MAGVWLPGSWDTEIDGLAAGALIDLGELVVGCGEADLEAFDLAEPAFELGFGDAGDEVAADLCDARPLGRIRPVQAAPQAALSEMILNGLKLASLDLASGHVTYLPSAWLGFMGDVITW